MTMGLVRQMQTAVLYENGYARSDYLVNSVVVEVIEFQSMKKSKYSKTRNHDPY
jgi:hypothetical protein